MGSFLKGKEVEFSFRQAHLFCQIYKMKSILHLWDSMMWIKKYF